MLKPNKAKNNAKSKDDDSDDIEITIFHKTDGILSKRISLTKSGVITADRSECWMSKGEATRKKLNGPASLADLIDNMPSEQALALGRLKPGLPDVVEIARKTGSGRVGTRHHRPHRRLSVFRTGEACLHAVRSRPQGNDGCGQDEAEGGGRVLERDDASDSGLAGAARVTRRSTSAGLYNARQANPLSGSLNRHVYISVKDGSDIARALTTVQDRLWLAGYGYFVVGAAGQLLVRSIIDAAVYGPERLVFEGAPELVPPVAQDATKRQARAFRGTIIDTALAIPSLKEEESARLAELKAQAAQSLEGAVAAKRKVWAAAFAKKHGLSEKEVERIASQALKHVLEDNFELTFDDRRLGGARWPRS